QHSKAKRNESDESLCGSAKVTRRALIYINLSGYEEEVVTDTMKENAGVEHPDQCAVIPESEQCVAQRPGRHTGQQHRFHSQAAEEPGHNQHEKDFRHLTERHLSCCIRHVQFVQKRVCECVIELEWNADQKRSQYEHGERRIAHQLQCVEADSLTPG